MISLTWSKVKAFADDKSSVTQNIKFVFPFSDKGLLLRGVKDWFILCYLIPFSTLLQIYQGSQCTYPFFPGVLLVGVKSSYLCDKGLTLFQTSPGFYVSAEQVF